jgi:enamine deaminase RidA (YjgF/YER057c/UK114 family)
MQISRHHVGPRMKQFVVHGDTIYLCGETAEEADGAAAQTGAILAKIDTLLAEAGSSKSKLLQVQIWLADIQYYDEMNADPPSTPGLATCEARMASPRFLAEIIVVAG